MAMNRNITDKDLDTAKRLKAIWEAKKKVLNLTQKSACSELGFGQTMFSMYINGTQALNLPTIMKFAKLLQMEPKQIDPDLTDYKIVPGVRAIKVPILFSVGSPIPSMRHGEIILKQEESTTSIFGVQISTTLLEPYIEKDSILFCDPLAKIEANMKVWGQLFDAATGHFIDVVGAVIEMGVETIQIKDFASDTTQQYERGSFARLCKIHQVQHP